MYKIIKATHPNKGAKFTNSKELKRKIKSSKPVNKLITEGVYQYTDRKGRICFQIEYSTIINSKDKIRVVGKELDLDGKPLQKVRKKK